MMNPMDLTFRQPEGAYFSAAPLKKRPFKEITSEFSLPISSAVDPTVEIKYKKFREEFLTAIPSDEQQFHQNMRRTLPTDSAKLKDPEYVAKRVKNNEAAKRSRECRKAKEDEMAIQVAFLENENISLKLELATIEREINGILKTYGLR